MHIHESIPMRLRRAYLTVHRTAQAHFARFGMTAEQYVLLSLLADEDGTTQKELSSRMCSDGNTITAMLCLLERKGLIQRERCSADGRARRVHLTELGIQIQRKLIASVKPLHDLMDEALVGRNREQFFECLDKIAKAMADPAKSVVDREHIKKRNTDSQLANTSR